MKDGFKSWIRQKTESIGTKIEKDILSNKSLKCKVVFGPVRSRRLGYVLGINNIEQKACSYDCIYCPSGKTTCSSVCTNYSLSPYELHLSVRNKLEELKRTNKKIDYIVFDGSGEPTLDSSLSKEILLLREFGYKIAVHTNASLLWNTNIQENLMFADYVSVKIDTVNEETWIKMNRPHRKLDYNVILEGIKQFSNRFQGTLTTETMLIKNVNDNTEEIEQLSNYFNTLKRKESYFMTPMHPPAESFAVIPDDKTLKKLSNFIDKKITNSVMLCCPETEEFFATDDFENEFLGLLSLHQVSVDAVKHFVKGNIEMKILNDFIAKRMIKEIDFRGRKFFAEETDGGLKTASEFTN
jgi:wyosine [tRNA(Phe)-imidazoG37] synthetase (radical SAM superfamily)